MIRIIDNVAYGSKNADFFNVKAHDLGNGHLEVVASRGTVWKELEWTADQIRDHLDMVEKQREEDAEEIAAKLLEQAAKRAKSKVRRVCKALGADTLLTLTYRSNQTNRALCQAHLKEFARRMRRALGSAVDGKWVDGDFRAIACFEKQKRGAWHVHLATMRLPFLVCRRDGVMLKSYDLIRAVWRSVTKEHGGNIDVQRRKRHSARTAASVAAYIAKYITKAFAEGEKWSNRYTKFGDVETPKPVDLGRFGDLNSAIHACYALLDNDHCVQLSHLPRFGDFFYLSAEKDVRMRLPI